MFLKKRSSLKSKLEKISNTKSRMSIEVPVERVNMAFEVVYNSFQKSADIKGFRKGKVPLSFIKAKYHSQIVEQVIKVLCENSLQEALQADKGFLPNNTQILIESDCQENAFFKFSVEFEHPSTDSGHLVDRLTLFKEPFNKDNIQRAVDFRINCMKDFLATEVPVTEPRSVQVNDSICINCRGFVRNHLIFELNNVHFDVLSAEGQSDQGHIKLQVRAKSIRDIYVARLNQISFTNNIEKNISGMKAGETKKFEPAKLKLDVFSLDDAYWEIDLKSIYTKQVQDLDDITVKEFGYSSLKEMNKKLKDVYEGVENERIKTRLEKSLLQALVNQNPFNLPEDNLLKHEMLNLIDDMKENMKNRGVQDDQLIEDVIDNWLNAEGLAFKEFCILKTKEKALVATLVHQWNISDPVPELLKDSPLEDMDIGNIKIKTVGSGIMEHLEKDEKNETDKKDKNSVNTFLSLTPIEQKFFLQGEDIGLSSYERVRAKVVEKLMSKAIIKTKSDYTFADFANPLLYDDEVGLNFDDNR